MEKAKNKRVRRNGHPMEGSSRTCMAFHSMKQHLTSAALVLPTFKKLSCDVHGDATRAGQKRTQVDFPYCDAGKAGIDEKSASKYWDEKLENGTRRLSFTRVTWCHID